MAAAFRGGRFRVRDLSAGRFRAAAFARSHIGAVLRSAALSTGSSVCVRLHVRVALCGPVALSGATVTVSALCAFGSHDLLGTRSALVARDLIGSRQRARALARSHDDVGLRRRMTRVMARAHACSARW